MFVANLLDPVFFCKNMFVGNFLDHCAIDVGAQVVGGFLNKYSLTVTSSWDFFLFVGLNLDLRRSSRSREISRWPPLCMSRLSASFPDCQTVCWGAPTSDERSKQLSKRSAARWMSGSRLCKGHGRAMSLEWLSYLRTVAERGIEYKTKSKWNRNRTEQELCPMQNHPDFANEVLRFKV